MDDALLHTALRLLAEGRYFGMSIQEIAEEALTTKTSVYRRFRGKEELAFAALASLLSYPEEPAISGDLRADLVWQLRQLQDRAMKYGGMLLTGVALMEDQGRSDWLRLLRSGVVRARHEQIAGVIRGAIKRGAARADADVDACVSMLAGCWQSIYLVNWPDIPEDWAERAVAVVLEYLTNFEGSQ
ncbi:MAG: TetR/AcrR family transcriptional regulator [Chloroflexota bacterium]